MTQTVHVEKSVESDNLDVMIYNIYFYYFKRNILPAILVQRTLAHFTILWSI